MKLTKKEQKIYDYMKEREGDKVDVLDLIDVYYAGRRISNNARTIVLDVMRQLALKTELEAANNQGQPVIRRITSLGRSFKAIYRLS